MLVLVNEIHVPIGSTIGVGRGKDPDGKTVWFGGDHRPMVGLMQAMEQGEQAMVSVDTWQVITDMSLVCETLGHDFEGEDVADGVVGGGAAHVYFVYCNRCDAAGGPEDIEEEHPDL